MTQIIKLACIVVLACHVVMSQLKGTTLGLIEIFRGRCLDYKITRSNSLASVPDVDCMNLWSKFSSPWIHKQPCVENVTSYGQMFLSVGQTLPRDKLLFWSGTGAFAHRLSDNGRRYVTLEDTFVGYVADGLKWCGRESGDGINYTGCPSYGSCPAEPVKNFWLDASRWFASQAAGEVTVVLNGSNPSRNAYTKDSIFGSLEVPSLQGGVVTKLKAIVVHSLGAPKIESCTSQSLRNLESDLLSQNIEFDCYENPMEVKMLLCLDSPNSPECGHSACDRNAAVIPGRLKFEGGMWARLTSATTVAALLMVNFFCK